MLIGIDIGSSQLKIADKKRGVFLMCPTQRVWVAHKGVDITDEGFASMAEFESDEIEIRRAVIDGRVQASSFVSQLLSEAFNQLGPIRLGKGRFAVAGISKTASTNESIALKRGIAEAGVWRVRLAEKSHSAWRGCAQENGIAFLIDLGAETTEITGVLGRLKTQTQIPFGGKKLDLVIQNYCRTAHQREISCHQAEQIKIELGSVSALAEEKSSSWTARTPEAMPEQLQLRSEEIRPCLVEALSEVSVAVRSVLKKMPDEIVDAVVKNGIMLCGGTSLLPGIAEIFQRDLDVPVVVAAKPFDAVAVGCLRK